MIHREDHGPVVLVTIDRPEVRNAVDLDALEALAEAFTSAAEAQARAVVLTGTGGHFCAGADLSGVEDRSFARQVRRTLDVLCHLPCPAIAAIDGFALGAGSQLAVACDLRVATPSARFGVPAGKLGLMVDHWTVQRLVSLAGSSAARAMLLAAEQIDGTQAHGIGFVNRLGSLDDALAWAQEIALLAPLSLAGHKLALNALERDRSDHDDVEQAIERAWTSEDLQEGIAAFRERRPPEFQGR